MGACCSAPPPVNNAASSKESDSDSEYSVKSSTATKSAAAAAAAPQVPQPQVQPPAGGPLSVYAVNGYGSGHMTAAHAAQLQDATAADAAQSAPAAAAAGSRSTRPSHPAAGPSSSRSSLPKPGPFISNAIPNADLIATASPSQCQLQTEIEPWPAAPGCSRSGIGTPPRDRILQTSSPLKLRAPDREESENDRERQPVPAGRGYSGSASDRAASIEDAYVVRSAF